MSRRPRHGFWIQDIRDLLGITVLMVEHDMSLVSAVSDRVLVPELRPADRHGHAGRGAGPSRSHPRVFWEAEGAEVPLPERGPPGPLMIEDAGLEVRAPIALSAEDA